MRTKPRVLFVVNSVRDLLPGSLFREFLDPAIRRGLDPVLAILESPPGSRLQKKQLPAAPCNFLGRRFHLDFGNAFQIRQLGRKHRVQLIQGWTGKANLAARLATIGSSMIKVALKTDLRLEPWLHVLDYTKALGVFDRILVTHSEIARRLKPYQHNERQIQQVKLGAPLPRFENVASCGRIRNGIENEIRESLRIPQDYFLIGINADMTPDTRMKDLLWATDLVQTIRSDFRVLIFGDGPQRWRLQRYARQCDAIRKVIFVDRNTDFFKWLPELDLYWHAYSHDPNPFALLAALRAGIPVMAPRSPGISDLVRDDLNGCLFDEGQRDQIARKTHALFSSPEKLKAMKAEAANTAEESPIEHFVEEVLASYDELLERNSAAL